MRSAEDGVAAAPATFEHIGLFYDDPATVADQLAATVVTDRSAERSVLVCLPEPLRRMLVDRVGPAAVTVIDDAVRYRRPIDAMAALWDFIQRAERDGANGVHSIGQIAFDGGPGDAPWHWYEDAVNDVFDGRRLRATCLFDLRRTPAEAVAACRASHPIVGGLADAVDVRGPEPSRRAPRIVPPARDPDVRFTDVRMPAGVRATLRRVTPHLDRRVVGRAQLVLSECIANAMIHGAGAADVDVWIDATGIDLEVRDAGRGIDDPFASLRPPELPVRGAGLWISHLESTSFSVARLEPSGTVANARVD